MYKVNAPKIPGKKTINCFISNPAINMMSINTSTCLILSLNANLVMQKKLKGELYLGGVCKAMPKSLYQRFYVLIFLNA